MRCLEAHVNPRSMSETYAYPLYSAHRFMANHTAEAPLGHLTHDILQSWFGVEGTNGNYNAVQGYERIPDNWYRRSIVAPYTIPYFLGDVLAAAALHPKFLDIGGNTGKTNTFTGVNITDLSAGLVNAETLTEGNNLGYVGRQTFFPSSSIICMYANKV